VADEIGVQQQVCKSHVLRNTPSLSERFQALVGQVADASLQAIAVSAAQAQADLAQLGDLIKRRRRQDAGALETLHHRYGHAVPPRPAESMSLASRLRLLYLDRWDLWFRLTRYRSWKGPKGERIDGTNNACERAIGCWIKERYRPMRGYKVPANAERVSRLLAWSGNFLNQAGANLALLLG
jgi:hypothetical protein